mgnify:CR=1 FL=1
MHREHIEKAMMMAIKKAEETMHEDLGGPFGAAIIHENGDIISVASNSVLGDHDPTAHAEINAIRKACNLLNTHDLSGYILITTSYPCPMCLGAIMWANIKHMVYGCSLDDAKNIGFRDDLMYNFINEGMKDEDILKVDQSLRDSCVKLFQTYHDLDKEIY